MNRILALICFAVLASGAALAGPTAGRTLVLDVANQDGSWSNLSTRGEAYYLKVDLRNRGQSYTNNDLTGYLWYATNSLSAAGVKINSYSKETGAVYFYLSATNTLGLSTNAESYFAQIILTNATGSVVYDWKQGRFATRHGSGLTGAGVAPSTSVINWDTITNTGTTPWSSGGGAVTSVFGRAGVVVAAAGDYTAGQVGAMTSGAVTSLVNSATQALATVAHTGAYGDLSGTPTIPSTNGLDTVVARASAITSATQALATVAHSGAYGDLSGTPSIPSTNGLDTVLAREQAVAASTQTIAGASVSGTVPSATIAGTLANGSVASNVTLRGGAWEVSAQNVYGGSQYILCRTTLGDVAVVDPVYLFLARTNNPSIGNYAIDWGGSITFDDSGVATNFGGSAYNLPSMNFSTRTLYGKWTQTTNENYSSGLDIQGPFCALGGGNVVTNGGNAGTLTNLPGSQVVGTVPSAAVAATATTLVANAVITVAPPVASNSPATKEYVDGMLVGNFVSFWTTNLVTSGTNGIDGLVFASLPTVPASSVSTGIVATAVGQYLATWIATNRTVTQLQGGAAEVEIWMHENTTPGSLTVKPEIYLYDTVREALVEFGENVASQTVAAGSVATKHIFSVPYGPLVTNNACMLAIRPKVTSIANTPTVFFYAGGATPSHFSIDVPTSSLVPDNAVNAYKLNNQAASYYVATNDARYLAALTNLTDSAIAAAGGVTGAVFAATGTTPSNVNGTIYIPTNSFGGGAGSANQTPLTNNVDAAGFSITNLLGLTSTAAVGQVAYQLPMGAIMRWYSNASNYVDQYAVSVGQMYWVSVSNNVAVTNIAQINP